MLASPFYAVRSSFAILCLSTLTAISSAQTSAPLQAPASPAQKSNTNPGPPASTSPAGGQAGAQGGDSKSASPSDQKLSASGKTTRLSPLDPSVPPPKVFARPRIGLALGGGGAVGLSEVGVLQWLEEHHIPVDVVAGTSMGCLVSSLYSTGRTPDQLTRVMNDRVFTSVFSFGDSYQSRSFRRREDSRELPNGITIGLKHRVSLRNAVLVDQGLNAFLDREFLRYDDQTDFNTLPIPLRCLATDLNEAKSVTFARGSVPDAVRASVSLPAVFPPFEMSGHEYVDGGVLVNLPTAVVRNDMHADVVIGVSLPLQPVAKGDLGSLLGVLARSFAVAIEAAERDQRRLADVVIIPDTSGFGATDYLKAVPLAQRGYAAAESHKSELLKYAVSDADWNAYLAHRASLVRGPAAPVLRVRVTAPDSSSLAAVQRMFAPLVNQPVDTTKIEAMLDQVRADGAFDADYTVGYETPQQFAAQVSGAAPLPAGTVDVAPTTKPGANSAGDAPQQPQQPGAPNPKPSTAPTSDQPGVPKSDTADLPGVADRPGATGLAATQEATAQSLADIGRRPIILVNVTRKKTGPPFLLLGANVEAQTDAFTRATVEGILLDQDFGGYGSELRSKITLGYRTELGAEYFRPLNPLASPEHTVFAAPRLDFLREPFPIFSNQVQVANRQLQRFDTGADIGLTNLRTQELRAGYDFMQLHWVTIIGSDGQPDFGGQAQRARLHYDYDTQDRALVPQFGLHVTSEFAYLYSAVDSPNAPQLFGKVSYAHRFSLQKAPPPTAPKDPNRGHEVFILAGEGGTMFDRNVAQPFRYTLGGPVRLSASSIDQYRGTDYWLIEPAILRRIAQLPQPLGQSIYLGVGLEAGQMHAPGVPVINRQDAYFGVVAETPLGVITLAPAIGSNGERKLVFTLGKLF
jgi:NTE family protein